MNLRFFLFLIILITNEVGQAQNTIPSLARVTEYLSPVPDFTPLATLNPALQYYHYEYSHTELSLTGNYRKADRAQIMQEGNGWKGFHIQARSWKKLNNNSCVWGEALYQNGRTANVRWNETSDFQTVYPYIMADTIGGDLQSETYRFQGGYARDHRHFTWGAVLAYKAIMEYRKKDPRPRNIVSDLDIKAGIAWKIGGNYVVGTSIRAHKYKQTNNVRFFSELGVYEVYHMTGLGMNYVRFSGTNNNTYYKGHTLDGSIELYPRTKQGISLSVRYDRFTFEKILSDLNNLPLNKVTENDLQGEAGWQHRYGLQYWGIRLSGRIKKRKGTENLFGDPVSNAYPQIGKVEQYTDRQIEANVILLYENRQKTRFGWNIRPTAGYRKIKESYLSPARQMIYDEINAGLQLQTVHIFGKACLLHLTATGTHFQNLSSDLQLNSLDDNHKLNEMLYSNYEMLSSNRTTLALSARCDYSGWLNNKTVFTQIQWQYNRWKSDIKSDYFSVSLGIIL